MTTPTPIETNFFVWVKIHVKSLAAENINPKVVFVPQKNPIIKKMAVISGDASSLVIHGELSAFAEDAEPNIYFPGKIPVLIPNSEIHVGTHHLPPHILPADAKKWINTPDGKSWQGDAQLVFLSTKMFVSETIRIIG